MSKTALITGITGQDGCYLAELLLAQGYQVCGTSRRHGARVEGAESAQVFPLDTSSFVGKELQELLASIVPDEIYHFAADSFVPNGWSSPQENLHANYGVTLAILEAMRTSCPQARFLNACSREVFGGGRSGLANEETEMRPTTPYGINKAASRWMVEAYRRQHGLFAANAILFNHESPRRGPQFVTRKVSLGAAEIACGLAQYIELGALSAQRDWGYAGDFVDAMWRILQQDEPEDFVLGTGKCHSIQELVEVAFGTLGLNWTDHVKHKGDLVRVGDSAALVADNQKARRRLGWEPKTDFHELIRRMVESDLRLCRSRQNDENPSQSANS